MPVDDKLLFKIGDYLREGYTDDEIIGGLSKSAIYPDIALKTQSYLDQGYNSKEILSGLSHSWKQPDRPWTQKHPTLYGFTGAAWGTTKTMLPYIRYVDPSERERFSQLSTQKQTRELLLQDLEAVGLLAAAPILKGGALVLKPLAQAIVPKLPILRKILPATYRALTKQRYIGKPKITAELQPRFPTKAQQDALRVENMYLESDAELERLIKPTVKGAYEALKRQVVDVSGNIKGKLLKEGGELGKEAIVRHDLIKGASSNAERLFDDAAKKIYGDLSREEERILNYIIQSRRTIAIKGYKPTHKRPGGFGIEEHQNFLNNLEPENFARLNQKADMFFGEMKTQLKTLRNAGLIDEQSYQALAQHEYEPSKYLQYLDPDRSAFTPTGKKISVPDSGIQRFKEGSENLLETNSRLLLSEVVSRNQGRIFKNEANKALYNLAKEIPDNGIVKVAKVAKKTKEGKFVFQQAPAGHEKVSLVIDGKQRQLIMPKSMAKEWITADPAINNSIANAAGWLSGAKILRPMATGLNPEFALTNFPRDIVHAWMTTHEYSPVMPKWMAQMGKDLARTTLDTFRRKGAYIDYINEGGGMSFLTHQGRVTQKLKGGFGTVQKVLGYLGETSEIWTRLALRNRALANGKTPIESTWIARNYLDFSQGGQFIKAVDVGVPYLNASVQATRGIARAAIEKPAEFVAKTAQLASLSAGLYLANRFTNQENWDSISDRDKVGNFIVTLPISYRDKNGEKRHLYGKIAKDQTQRLVSTLTDNLVGKYLGDDIDIDQVTQAAKDLIPIIPTQVLPPTMSAILGYFANKDFWANKDIWKGPKVETREEYTNYTHPGLVRVGQVTGASPERLKSALSKYFTYGNIYTSIVGGGLKQIMDKLPSDMKEKANQEILTSMPFIRRTLKSTYPYTKHRKQLEKAKIDASTQRYKMTRQLDAFAEKYYTTKEFADKVEAEQFISAQTVQDRKLLRNRFKRYGKLYGLEDKSWWLNLGSLPPETRAVIYWTRWEQADTDEKRRLESQLPKVPGIKSTRFSRKLAELRRQK